MTIDEIYNKLRENPVICALNDVNDLEHVVKSPCDIVFLLTGDITNLSYILNTINDANKLAFLHLDLIKGFSKDAKAIEFIKDNYEFAGVMSTKVSLLKIAKAYDIFVIQRLFMLDSAAFDMSMISVNSLNPDAVEIMPGIVPKIIKRVKDKTHIPIIAGGLIDDKQEIIECLKSGAISISTTNKSLWYV